MTLWPEIRDGGWLSDILRDDLAVAYWTRKFDAVYCGEIDSWASPWVFSCCIQGALTILPAVNLVQNIGFTDDATHTRDGSEHSIPTLNLSLRLGHPPHMIRDERADDWTQRHIFGYGHVSVWDRVRRLVAR